MSDQPSPQAQARWCRWCGEPIRSGASCEAHADLDQLDPLHHAASTPGSGPSTAARSLERRPNVAGGEPESASEQGKRVA